MVRLIEVAAGSRLKRYREPARWTSMPSTIMPFREIHESRTLEYWSTIIHYLNKEDIKVVWLAATLPRHCG